MPPAPDRTICQRMDRERLVGAYGREHRPSPRSERPPVIGGQFSGPHPSIRQQSKSGQEGLAGAATARTISPATMCSTQQRNARAATPAFDRRQCHHTGTSHAAAANAGISRGPVSRCMRGPAILKPTHNGYGGRVQGNDSWAESVQPPSGDPVSFICDQKIRAFDVVTKLTALNPHHMPQATANFLPASGSAAVEGHRG